MSQESQATEIDQMLAQLTDEQVKEMCTPVTPPLTRNQSVYEPVRKKRRVTPLPAPVVVSYPASGSLQMSQVTWLEEAIFNLAFPQTARVSRSLPSIPSYELYRIRDRISLIVRGAKGYLEKKGAVLFRFNKLRPTDPYTSMQSQCYTNIQFSTPVSLANVEVDGQLTRVFKLK